MEVYELHISKIGCNAFPRNILKILWISFDKNSTDVLYLKDFCVALQRKLGRNILYFDQ